MIIGISREVCLTVHFDTYLFELYFCDYSYLKNCKLEHGAVMLPRMVPISYIETPFKEKFGVPRQSLLVTQAWGKMEFDKNDFNLEAFRGIEQFSHLWLIFKFHHIDPSQIKALIRPPRFKGKQKWGIYATRSPHRPNQLGLSVVEFDRLDLSGTKIILWVRGVDMVSGTPILDIRPYLPYVDAHPEATAGPFDHAPEFYPVKWLVEKPREWQLIEKVIALDPRSSFGEQEEFGVSIAGLNVRFRFSDDHFVICQITKTSSD
jgi:tRNA (adenine37-N6)-methyltransferase